MISISIPLKSFNSGVVLEDDVVMQPVEPFEYVPAKLTDFTGFEFVIIAEHGDIAVKVVQEGDVLVGHGEGRRFIFNPVTGVYSVSYSGGTGVKCDALVLRATLGNNTYAGRVNYFIRNLNTITDDTNVGVSKIMLDSFIEVNQKAEALQRGMSIAINGMLSVRQWTDRSLEQLGVR